MADASQPRLKTTLRRASSALRPALSNTLASLRAISGLGEPFALFDGRIRLQFVPVKGRDGFLFHRDHDVLEQLAGSLTLAPRQIAVWRDAFAARQAWCDANGAAMRVLFIPEKHVVYREKLPRFVKIAARRATMRLAAAAAPVLAAPPLYPVEALRAASARRRTYLKTDTHWTNFGAFVAYRVLAESLATSRDIEIASEAELVWKERRNIGDLGVRYQRERGETIEVAAPVARYTLAFQNHNFSRGAVHVYENERRDLPTCVLFRDSFSNALIPFLMRGFSRLVAVSSLSCHYDLLDHERPDVVLFVAIERFIATFGMGHTIELPEDAAGRPFEAFSGTALGELPRRED